MTIKYKVHDFAKDTGLKSTEIIELLNKLKQKERTHMAILDVEEVDYLLNYYTKQNAVDSFDKFLDDGKKAAEAKLKSVKEAEETPKPVKEKKAPESKPAATRAQTEKPVLNTQNPDDKKEKPQKSTKKDSADAKPAAKELKQEKKEQKPPKRVLQPVKQLKEKPKKEKRSVNPADITFEKKVRVVDTRTTDVNLGKYDEKLDELASSHETRKTASTQSKQKIVKKNNYQDRYGRKKARESEAERLKRIEQQRKKAQLKILVPDEISVGELAHRMKVNVAQVVAKLMGMGVMASASQNIDFDTAYLIGEEFSVKVEREVILTIEDRLIDDTVDAEADLQPRDPVVVVMGHVDHGKTSLLDAIRNTSVVAGEAGGITQHIGAYKVKVGEQEITFLDTPGHAAFTQMRARGAAVTDIAILVVAADDGIMPQTVEAINHAKAANIPIIVAINKMDKENADPDRVKQELTEYELVPEEWGGETICVPISALKGDGIDTLLEMVLLVAEVNQYKANPNRLAKGTVIEAYLDKGRGPVSTLLVQNGTLKSGDIIIAGSAVGKIRAMTNDKHVRINEAGPSMPVEIIGLSEVPQAGDPFFVVEDERLAKELAEQRRAEDKLKQQSQYTVSLDDLFSRIQEGNMKELNIIVKADVQGSAEAVKSSLEKISNEEVRVRVIHSAVGAINESDVMLANASNAIIVGFNVRPETAARASAEKSEVDIRLYSIIYDCIEEIEAAMKGMLAPKFKEVVLGYAEVRQVFKASGVGTIAGSYVKEGKIVRNASVRLLRDNTVIFTGNLSSLKRFKDDAKEVLENFECGITIENYNDIKEGDIIEAYEMQEIKQ
ncbi:MAG: translation initiation factor IF-2 [Clostridia bacterium]|nr:translation initiation factor IF-2 [Clostridia bacterium]